MWKRADLVFESRSLSLTLPTHAASGDQAFRTPTGRLRVSLANLCLSHMGKEKGDGKGRVKQKLEMEDRTK